MSKRKLQDEPLYNPMTDDQEGSFLGVINWYRGHTTTKKCKLWVSDYMKSKGFSKDDVEKAQLGDSFLHELVGPYCRACSLSDEDAPGSFSDAITNNIQRLISAGNMKIEKRKEIAEEKNELEQPKKVLSIQEKIENQVSEYMTEINVMIDQYIENIQDKKTIIKIEEWLKRNSIKSIQSGMVAEKLIPMVEELTLAYDKKDKQLEEGYDFLSRPQLKKFRDTMKNIVTTCEEYSNLTKATKRPRRKKSRTPGQIIRKLKYCKTSEEYSVSSVDPKKIVGASKVVIFNEKYRTLTIYEASPLVDGLSVKGTTIVGFDKKTSKTMTLRKPKEFINKTKGKGIRVFKNALKEISTKQKLPTGRVNNNCIIMHTF